MSPVYAQLISVYIRVVVSSSIINCLTILYRSKEVIDWLYKFSDSILMFKLCYIGLLWVWSDKINITVVCLLEQLLVWLVHLCSTAICHVIPTIGGTVKKYILVLRYVDLYGLIGQSSRCWRAHRVYGNRKMFLPILQRKIYMVQCGVILLA